jgi:hypothetical protein
MEERERERGTAPPPAEPPAGPGPPAPEEPERVEPTEAAPKADRETPGTEDDPHK